MSNVKESLFVFEYVAFFVFTIDHLLDKCLEQFWAETTVITFKSRLAQTGVAIVSI